MHGTSEVIEKLVVACRTAETALRDHPQYDNPDDEPSQEALALSAVREAIIFYKETK